jgi:hypothetical protein
MVAGDETCRKGASRHPHHEDRERQRGQCLAGGEHIADDGTDCEHDRRVRPAKCLRDREPQNVGIPGTDRGHGTGGIIGIDV